VPIVLKSGSLNLLERSGPLLACNGIALPFTLHKGDTEDDDNNNNNNNIVKHLFFLYETFIFCNFA
jgi:hypothetical protein